MSASLLVGGYTCSPGRCTHKFVTDASMLSLGASSTVFMGARLVAAILSLVVARTRSLPPSVSSIPGRWHRSFIFMCMWISSAQCLGAMCRCSQLVQVDVGRMEMAPGHKPTASTPLWWCRWCRAARRQSGDGTGMQVGGSHIIMAVVMEIAPGFRPAAPVSSWRW